MRIRIFRWKAIGPLLLFLLVLGILIWLFAEPVARDTTEEAGTEFLGTQVDVGKLDIIAQQASVDLRALQVADPFDVTRNLVEAEHIDPFVRDIYLREAESLKALGRPAEAVAALRTALLVDPRMEPGYTRAAPDGEGADEERRRQAEILVDIAEIELEAGDGPAAQRDLQRALELWPDCPRAIEVQERLQP